MHDVAFENVVEDVVPNPSKLAIDSRHRPFPKGPTITFIPNEGRMGTMERCYCDSKLALAIVGDISGLDMLTNPTIDPKIWDEIDFEYHQPSQSL